MTRPDAGGVLTAGQVGARLGLKAGMVRRYALALEAVTGISLEVDPIRGRLYAPEVVELLEATRAHLLQHPGQGVEAAMRAVTGQSEGGITPAARVPGTLTPVALEEALRGVLLPVLAELQEQRRENEALRAEVADLRQRVEGGQRATLAELGGLRGQVARLEVTAHAALPPADQRPPEPRGWLARFLHQLTGRGGS